MNSESQKSVAPSSARRRLVRGAFSAPAIFTLCSGSALATTSSTQCLSYKVNSSPAHPTGTAVDGTWLRVQRYVKNSTYYIKGADVCALIVGKSPTPSVYIASNCWQNVSTAPYAKNLTFTTVPTIDTGKYVAVRVDASGNIVGFCGDGTTAASSGVPGTCWASFKGL